MGPEFFQTRLGQEFFQGTLPRLVAALEALGARRPTETIIMRVRASKAAAVIPPPNGEGWRFRAMCPAEDEVVFVVWERLAPKETR